MLTEIIHTLILQSYTVQHTRGCFHHTRVVIALTWMQGCALHNDAAQSVQWDEVGKLGSVAKGS